MGFVHKKVLQNVFSQFTPPPFQKNSKADLLWIFAEPQSLVNQTGGPVGSRSSLMQLHPKKNHKIVHRLFIYGASKHVG